MLAAYDLGASASLLQKIYDVEAADQTDIHAFEPDGSGNAESIQQMIVTDDNWSLHLGEKRSVVPS